MRAMQILEGRQYVAENSANEAVLKSTGQRFYSGAFDPLDGHILEIHSYEQAVDADHHHSFYFTPRMVEKMSRDEANFFWIAKMQLHTMWRVGEAPPPIKRAILSQIEISAIRPEIPGMQSDMIHAPSNDHIMLYLPNGQSVTKVAGYFRDDDKVWGWVSTADPDTEINPVGWSLK